MKTVKKSEFMRDFYVTGTGQPMRVHLPEDCTGDACVVHRPSDHHMRAWPTHWRVDRQIMERICPHGTGHPDPDGHYRSASETLHDCDGCCALRWGAW